MALHSGMLYGDVRCGAAVAAGARAMAAAIEVLPSQPHHSACAAPRYLHSLRAAAARLDASARHTSFKNVLVFSLCELASRRCRSVHAPKPGTLHARRAPIADPACRPGPDTARSSPANAMSDKSAFADWATTRVGSKARPITRPLTSGWRVKWYAATFRWALVVPASTTAAAGQGRRVNPSREPCTVAGTQAAADQQQHS